jgi:TolB-like protein/DNA-binding SARP family transcriptional activator
MSAVVYELRLAGRLRLIRSDAGDGVEVTPTGKKAQGILALLGVAPGLRRHRSWLQDKLWSDRSPEHGSSSLRQAIAALRTCFDRDDSCFITEGGWVALDPARVRVRLDPDPDEWELTGEPPEFAAGLDIADPEFEDWLRDQRAAVAERLSTLPRPVVPVPVLAEAAAAPPEPATRSFFMLETPPEPSPSIAVMPLVVLAEGPAGSMVATGLCVDIIGRLTRYRRIDVIAYTSTLSVASLGLSPREIGRRLGVRYVTQGALWLDRSRLRLTFDLVDAASERVLWSQSFDRACEDVFDLETEIAAAVAGGVMVEIDQLERARVRARDPDSLAAYELCLRGLDEMLRLDQRGCHAALGYFVRAAHQEFGYARALAGISRAHGFQWKYRWVDDREAALERAEEYALQAVDFDGADPSANAGLGWVALYSREHDRSLAAYSRALELNPSDADILAEYADSLKHAGEPSQAVPLFERAIRLNPYKSDHYLKDLAHTYLVSEDYDAAIRTVHRMRRPAISLRVLAASYALAGQMDAARRTAEMVRRNYPGVSAEAWSTMVPDRNPDYTARFVEGMKRAGL